MAKKILIVEDSPTLRENLSQILTERGYEVKTTDADEELWNMLKEEFFDLLILDLILPGKNTSVILGGLKSVSPKMRVLIYSGYEEYENSPYSRLADAFLCKSCSPEDFIATVEKLLSG